MRPKTSKINTPRALLALALTLAAVLVAMGIGIGLTHRQSKQQILANFRGKGTISAGFVSTFVSEQAAREATVAQHELSGKADLPSRFQRVVASFGSQAAVLLDSSGRLLQVAPSNATILGTRIAPRYPHLTAAEAGHAAVSGVVPSAAQHKPVIAIAVPYATANGRRVFSVAYPVAGSVLTAFVRHTVAFKRHLVLLVDAKGNVITSSSHASGTSFAEADPALARAARRATQGSATVAGEASAFVVTPVAGTPWHVVIAIPNDELFGSISGWAQWLPWIVLSVITLLALAVLGLFWRSLFEHQRLEEVSAELDAAAHTDPLTGLANRRALHDRLPQAWAYANRHDEPLSVLIIDLDDFKEINDTYGHDVGDEVLLAVADCMREVFRASDIFGRWGGDEFVAFLPGTDLDGAHAAGERLRGAFDARDFSRSGPSEQITLSFGCAPANGVSTHDMLVQADQALYRAKEARRSVVAGPDSR